MLTHTCIDPVLRNLVDRNRLEKDSNSDEVAVAEAREHLAAYDRKYHQFATELSDRTLGVIEAVAPCTALQEGMISRSLDRQRDAPYFNSFSFKLGATVDLGRLRNAWQRVVDQLQILRTWFMRTGDGYAQVVMRKPKVVYRIEDVVALTIRLMDISARIVTSEEDRESARGILSEILQVPLRVQTGGGSAAVYDLDTRGTAALAIIEEKADSLGTEGDPSTRGSLAYIRHWTLLGQKVPNSLLASS